MSYLGQWEIDDLLTFYANTHRFDTGAATDADSVPSYRVYEDETATPLLTGTMALLDSTNTAGFYSEQITLSAANGFEAGKSYSIYVSATVNSVVATMHHGFQITALGTITDIIDAMGAEVASGHSTAGTWGKAWSDAATAPGLVTSLATKVLKYFQLLFRKDAAIATDNATEVSEINADEGAGAGAYDNTTDSQEANAAADLTNAIWAKVLESQGSLTAQQIMQVIVAVLAGVTTDAGATIKTPNGVATRVAATINSSNERTGMTLTP